MTIKNFLNNFDKRKIRFTIVLSIVAAIHIAAFIFIKINIGEKEVRKDNKIYHMSSVKEYVPKEVVQIERQERVAEKVIETEKEIKETCSDYLNPMEGADLPIFPDRKIKSRLVYPRQASEEGIEDIVILELFIDKDGNIMKIVVIDDPGYGFGKAAVKAFTGIKCIPAKKKGIPFAIRLRKRVRFSLK